MAETVEIELEHLKMLFDLICNSMDFGSGFLDTDDVTLLRGIAVIIGVDPMEATPSEFRKRIKHAWRKPKANPWISATTGEPVKQPCYWCSKLRDDPIHAGEVPSGLSRESNPASTERTTP